MKKKIKNIWKTFKDNTLSVICLHNWQYKSGVICYQRDSASQCKYFALACTRSELLWCTCVGVARCRGTSAFQLCCKTLQPQNEIVIIIAFNFAHNNFSRVFLIYFYFSYLFYFPISFFIYSFTILYSSFANAFVVAAVARRVSGRALRMCIINMQIYTSARWPLINP